MMEGQEIISDLRYEKNTLQSNFRMVKQYFQINRYIKITLIIYDYS